MAYTITIEYRGTETDVEQLACQICRIFTPSSSYVDTAAYAGTKFDTNVPGWGSTPLVEPYASTSIPFPVPLAQFKLAVVGTPIKNEDGTEVIGHTVTFTTDDYKEAFYYKELGYSLKEQGFVITVTEASTSSGSDNTGKDDPTPEVPSGTGTEVSSEATE